MDLGRIDQPATRRPRMFDRNVLEIDLAVETEEICDRLREEFQRENIIQC